METGWEGKGRDSRALCFCFFSSPGWYAYLILQPPPTEGEQGEGGDGTGGRWGTIHFRSLSVSVEKLGLYSSLLAVPSR